MWMSSCGIDVTVLGNYETAVTQPPSFCRAFVTLLSRLFIAFVSLISVWCSTIPYTYMLYLQQLRTLVASYMHIRISNIYIGWHARTTTNNQPTRNSLDGRWTSN